MIRKYLLASESLTIVLKREMFFYWDKENKYIKFHETNMESSNVELERFKG